MIYVWLAVHICFYLGCVIYLRRANEKLLFLIRRDTHEKVYGLHEIVMKLKEDNDKRAAIFQMQLNDLKNEGIKKPKIHKVRVRRSRSAEEKKLQSEKKREWWANKKAQQQNTAVPKQAISG